ncbi:MAG: hypothetical protein H0U27_01160 [Nitrosopumilus sp.]|nr:hypothetical protein [Nitrosopumilus sp.]
MDYRNSTSQKDYKPFVSHDGHLSTNQIDTLGPLLAEIYRIVQRMDKREEEVLKKLSRMRNDQ